MSMSKYELIREDGWKLLWRDDKAFEHGEAPIAKPVISYFCKRRESDPVVNITKQSLPKEIVYDRVVELSWAEDRLNKTLQYKRKWYGDQDIYQFVVLCDYLQQAKSNGNTKVLLSSRELATLLPNKK